MVIPVVEHDRTKQPTDRHRENLLVAVHEAPHLRQRRFVERPEMTLCVVDALLKVAPIPRPSMRSAA